MPIINGTSGNDTLNGGSSVDSIYGLGGDDIITGGGSTDLLDGGEGSDIYMIGSATEHVAAEFRDSGTNGSDEVRFAAITAQTLTFFAGDLYIERIVIGTGTGVTAVTTGVLAHNIDARALGYGVAIIGNSGNNTLQASGFADQLSGGNGNDSLYGFDGHDRLDGGLGDDLIDGGLGSDTATFANSGSAVNVSLAIAGAQNTGQGMDTLTAIENLAGSAFADTLTGDSGANIIDGGAGNDALTGGSGNDFLIGGAGNDQLDGGDGSDVYFLSSADEYGADAISDSGASGSDELRFAATETPQTLVLAAGTSDIERIVIGRGTGETAISTDIFHHNVDARAMLTGVQIFGNYGNNIIYGGAGNDYLNGGLGYDHLYGGAGDDTYVVDFFTTAYEQAGEGIDTIMAVTSWTLGDTFENLTLATSAVVDGTGNGGANIIIGGASQNVLRGLGGDDQIYGNGGNDDIYGGDGNDILHGGTGDDSYWFVDAGDQVVEAAGAGQDTIYTMASYVLPDNVETLILSNYDLSGTGNALANTIIGNVGNDILNGMAGNDELLAFEGNDILIGGAGDDSLDGGAGVDAASYAEATGGVTASLAIAGPQNTIGAGIDTLTGIESLIGSEFADSLTGNSSNNVLLGNAGNDTLTGGLGIDTLTGGVGADIFIDSLAGLSGDTISDFTIGDKIVFSDATLAGFTFNLTGSTLTYTGGSLTLTGGVLGTLVAGAAVGGGVQLTIQAEVAVNDVRNDFDGDGRSDILWRNDAGQLSNWLGTANGGFVTNDANAFASVPTNWQIAGTGDFNGDGRADVLWRSDSGQVSNWLGQANGGFVTNDANAFASVPTNWHVAGTGDFNGDGRDDILWRNDAGQLSNWLGTASGGFTNNDANAFGSAPTDWHVAGTGDFNGDGRDDILWRNDAGQLSNWLGQANGGFVGNDANAFASAPTSWHIAGTGDFNGDGRDDILWRSDSGQLSNWLGQANGGFVGNDANAFTTVPTNWDVAAVGDYNGDGFDDILWRSDTGQLSNWLGTATGGFTNNDANAFNTVPTNWHVQPDDLLV